MSGARCDVVSEMPKEERWRADVLSSSLPLEYQVASVLVNSGFSVTADYSYTVPESAKEYSVDIAAFDLVFKGGNGYHDIAASLQLLVECKYRRPDTIWLFIPDPNNADWAQRRPGATLRTVDQFSPIIVPADATGAFDGRLRTALKGTEVRLWKRDSNRVDDEELRHGIDQLQFAIAPMLMEHVRENLEEATNYEKWHTVLPLFILPLMVTTADIRIAHRDFSVASLESSDLDAWSDSVPSVVLTRTVGPLARQSLRAVVDTVDLASFDAGVKKLNELRGPYAKNRVNTLPSRALAELRAYASLGFRPMLSQCLICRLDVLEAILSDARQTIEEVLGESIDSRVDVAEKPPR